MEPVVVAFATHPERGPAVALASALVEEGLAACVQVLPGVSSVYRWQGVCETSEEVRLEMKTTAARVAALRARFVELHPYEVPELLVLSVDDGLPAYLDWVRESVAEKP